jgi:hypothetical protein
MFNTELYQKYQSASSGRRGRNFCQLFFETKLEAWMNGEILYADKCIKEGAIPWDVVDIRNWMRSINCGCRSLHTVVRCDVDIAHWMADRARMSICKS